MNAQRCGVGEPFPEWCQGEAAYRARWTNGDIQILCVEHAAWVRANSDDLDWMQTLPVTGGSGDSDA